MPAKHTLHVVLNESLVRYVRDKVEAGHHPTISEVVRESLRALMERDEIAKPTAHLNPVASLTSNG